MRKQVRFTNPYINIWGNPKIGEKTKIGAYVEIGSNRDIPTSIGNNCKIEAFAFIPPGTFIGNRVFIGPHVCLTNDKHPRAIGNWTLSRIVIMDDASIGANATILPGLTIGYGSKIGAGAVVTKDVPDGEVWVGNPAHKI